MVLKIILYLTDKEQFYHKPAIVINKFHSLKLHSSFYFKQDKNDTLSLPLIITKSTIHWMNEWIVFNSSFTYLKIGPLCKCNGDKKHQPISDYILFIVHSQYNVYSILIQLMLAILVYTQRICFVFFLEKKKILPTGAVIRTNLETEITL